jgi:hypothetical protein
MHSAAGGNLEASCWPIWWRRFWRVGRICAPYDAVGRCARKFMHDAHIGSQQRACTICHGGSV